MATSPIDEPSPRPSPQPVVIDCDECCMQGTPACEDCVVTFICGRAAREAVIIPVDELRALRMLHEAGLVPGLRHRREAG